MRTADENLANGICSAMQKVNTRVGPDDDEDDFDTQSTDERINITDLAKASALPSVLEGEFERDVDVLSEPLAIDTSRADKPPTITPMCIMWTRVVLLMLACVSAIISAIVFGVYGAGLYENDCDASLSDSSLVVSIGKVVSGMNNSTVSLVYKACSRTKMLLSNP